MTVRPTGVGSAAIVLGVVWLERLFDAQGWARPLAFLGDASYSIYLSHTFVVPACVVALKHLGLLDPAGVFVLTSIAVMVAGAASYLWLERPLIALFKRLLFRPRPDAYPHAASSASE